LNNSDYIAGDGLISAFNQERMNIYWVPELKNASSVIYHGIDGVGKN